MLLTAVPSWYGQAAPGSPPALPRGSPADRALAAPVVTPVNHGRVATLLSPKALGGSVTIWRTVAAFSTFLHPLAPRALPRFNATMGALTPARRFFLPTRRAMNAVWIRAGLPGYGNESSVPSASNHLLPSRNPCLGLCPPGLPRGTVVTTIPLPLARVSASWASPVTRKLARTAGRIEFACAADGTFTWGCSPPPLARTQLPSVTGLQTSPGKDLHLAGSLPSQAHECGEESPLWLFFGFCFDRCVPFGVRRFPAALAFSPDVNDSVGEA